MHYKCLFMVHDPWYETRPGIETGDRAGGMEGQKRMGGKEQEGGLLVAAWETKMLRVGSVFSTVDRPSIVDRCNIMEFFTSQY